MKRGMVPGSFTLEKHEVDMLRASYDAGAFGSDVSFHDALLKWVRTTQRLLPIEHRVDPAWYAQYQQALTSAQWDRYHPWNVAHHMAR